MKAFSVRGRTKCLGRSLPKRTYIASSIHVTMMYVVGILPPRLLVGRYCKQDLYGRLCKEMRISGVKHVMFVNSQGLDDFLMVHSSLSLLLGHLRNGALMPLGLCQELRQARSIS